MTYATTPAIGFTGNTDGMSESERRHLRESARLDALEEALFELPDFQNEAFDEEGDDLVLATGADARLCELAIDRTLRLHANTLINHYTRQHFCRCLNDSQLTQQIEAVEHLIEQFTPRLSASQSVPLGGLPASAVPSPFPAGPDQARTGRVDGGASSFGVAA
jgi:hypothetical protein